jgi:Bacterial Ig-like domain (group 3)
MITLRRPLAASVAVVLGLAAAFMTGVAPANAVPAGASDPAQFNAAVADSTVTGITLFGQVLQTGTEVVIPRDLIIDLNGHALWLLHLKIDPGMTLTVNDSSGCGCGDLIGHSTDGVPNTAGISTGGATLIINGGHVTGDGKNSAGIGGDYSGGGGDNSSGTITINGGAITGNAGSGGAGIGSAGGGSVGTITINGGTVTTFTNNTSPGAGIGGGIGGGGGTIIIGSGADVTASTEATGVSSVIGNGGGSSASGSIDISGTVHVPSGKKLVTSAAVPVTVATGGVITGAGSLITTAGYHATVVNDGTINIATVDTTNDASGYITVTGHSYDLTFHSTIASVESTAVIHIFADNFAASLATLPDPVRSGLAITAWNDSSDLSGVWFSGSYPISSDTDFYGTWGIPSIVLDHDGDTVAAGSTVVFTVTGYSANGRSLGTLAASLVSDTAGDVVSGMSITVAGVWDHFINASLIPSEGDAVQDSAIIHVTAGPYDHLSIVGPLTVTKDSTVTFTANELDATDNVRDTVVDAIFFAPHGVLVNGNDLTFAAVGDFVVRGFDNADLTHTASVNVHVDNGAFDGSTVDVSGTLAFGNTLTATVTLPHAAAGLAKAFTWHRGLITIGTGSTYTLTAADVAASLTVDVALSATDYDPLTVTSSTIDIAKDTAKITVSYPSSFKVGKKTAIKITLAAGLSKLKPTGTVRLYYGTKSVVATWTSSGSSSKTLTLPALKKGTYVLHAVYVGSDKYDPKTTSNKTLKAK